MVDIEEQENTNEEIERCKRGAKRWDRLANLGAVILLAGFVGVGVGVVGKGIGWIRSSDIVSQYSSSEYKIKRIEEEIREIDELSSKFPSFADNVYVDDRTGFLIKSAERERAHLAKIAESPEYIRDSKVEEENLSRDQYAGFGGGLAIIGGLVFAMFSDSKSKRYGREEERERDRFGIRSR